MRHGFKGLSPDKNRLLKPTVKLFFQQRDDNIVAGALIQELALVVNNLLQMAKGKSESHGGAEAGCVVGS